MSLFGHDFEVAGRLLSQRQLSSGSCIRSRRMVQHYAYLTLFGLDWKNSSGLFTASLVEQHDTAAVAKTPKEALEQHRSLLDWQYREEPWRDPPDLKDPELHLFRVSVRPEYRDEFTSRRFPVQQTFEFRICCVVGKQTGSSRLASIPMIGLRLNLSEQMI